MQLPRIKHVFPPMPVGDGRIRIGGEDFGIASEIQDDEHGTVWRLLALLDGTRTVRQVADDLRRDRPTVTVAEVEDVVGTLTEMGFLEDAAVPPPAGLSPVELDRYRRNLEFLSYFHRPPLTPGDFQLRLRESSVTVLGVGGLGSFVALSLAAMGVGELLLIDHDHVELMNLNRQVLYTDADVGRAKVDAAAERLATVNPHTRITVRREKVDSPERARAAMAGRDLLVCAADRPRFRIYQWLNEAALRERVAWIRGGNSGLTASLCMHVPYRTACFTCVEREARETIAEYTPLRRHLMAMPEWTINPCTAPMAGLLGNLAAFEAVKLLTGITEPTILGRKIMVDVARMDVRFADGRHYADCPDCGTGADGSAAPSPVDAAARVA